MESEYKFYEIFERASVDDYVKLFEKSYGPNKKLSREYLNWLYNKNPHGRAIGMDAYIDGEIAAHYVTVPRRYQAGVRSFRAVLSVNTATHPAHQRRGLFKRLAELTYDLAAKSGYDYVIGVANDKSIRGFLDKLNFSHLGQVGLSICRKPIGPSPEQAHLVPDQEWISWRLNNPSASYFLTKRNDGGVVINCRRGLAVFSLGTVSIAELPSDMSPGTWRSFRGLMPLSPVYPTQGARPRVPKAFMPSPWHLIVRNLKSSSEQAPCFYVDGLSMDTF